MSKVVSNYPCGISYIAHPRMRGSTWKLFIKSAPDSYRKPSGAYV